MTHDTNGPRPTRIVAFWLVVASVIVAGGVI
jgi:hypothetical protein